MSVPVPDASARAWNRRLERLEANERERELGSIDGFIYCEGEYAAIRFREGQHYCGRCGRKIAPAL